MRILRTTPLPPPSTPNGTPNPFVFVVGTYEVPIYPGDTVTMGPNAQVSIVKESYAPTIQPAVENALLVIKLRRHSTDEGPIDAVIVIRHDLFVAEADDYYDRKKVIIDPVTNKYKPQKRPSFKHRKWEDWAPGCTRTLVLKSVDSNTDLYNTLYEKQLLQLVAQLHTK